MAPVILELRRRPWARVRVLATAQHRDMLDQVLGLFDIAPDRDLDLMRPDQDLAELTARMLTALDGALAEEQPAAVLVQGDTTTVLAAALACFYRACPVRARRGGPAHARPRLPVPRGDEPHGGRAAGAPSLRADRLGPRQPAARRDRRRRPSHVTGNTVIDALLQVSEMEAPLPDGVPADRRLILVTAHRRENFGEPLAADLPRAAARWRRRTPTCTSCTPCIPTPTSPASVRPALGGHPRITLCEPLDYLPFVAADEAQHAHPHRLRRRAGGGAGAGQAGAGAARRRRSGRRRWRKAW